jgi:hypothetical protein
MNSKNNSFAWGEELLRTSPDLGLAFAINQALKDFLRVDRDLLIRDVNERTISSSFAEHLRKYIIEWQIDCEYNRDIQEIKRANGKIVIPNIIVHIKGTNKNQLVIEIKKSNTKEPDELDIAKLREMKDPPLVYRYGLFIKFLIDPNNPDVERIQWV